MTREEAKELLPFIQAFAEGKTIQVWTNNTWKDEDYPFFGPLCQFRIKPEPEYRPFKTQEECWNEMLKHQPFGWLKVKTDGRYRFISELGSLSVLLTKVVTVTPSHESIPYSTTMFGVYTFADGTPFGVKNE